MSVNVTEASTNPPIPTSLVPHRHHKALEDICITLAVFTLIIINIALFLFWRYKALGKSPLPFRRYSQESEGYASLHRPMMTKDSIPDAPQRRAQEVLKQYASTVVRVGQDQVSRKSSSSLYASFNHSSESSPVKGENSQESKARNTLGKKSEDRCSILAYEHGPATRIESVVYDDSPVRFKLGHPEEDSTTTGGESDSQVYCEVGDVSTKRHARHISPISFDYCKDKDDSRSFVSRNNNDVSIGGESNADSGTENLYENFRRRKPTSNFASMTKSLGSPSRDSLATMYSTCRTVSGDYATCDESGTWRPTSFAFCRDTQPTVNNTTSSIKSTVPEQEENATYERFLEPDDPIYAQTVIRGSRRSVKQSSLPRDVIVNSQPLYEQPLYEQPLYENVNKDGDRDDTDHRYSTLHLDTPINNHLTSSDSKINVNTDSRRSRRAQHGGGGPEYRSPIREARDRSSVKTCTGNTCENPVSPHATSPGVTIPESSMSPNQNSFYTIAHELAGLHEDSVEEFDPEESFPVMQMLSDRYSTGNFLNKFY